MKLNEIESIQQMAAAATITIITIIINEYSDESLNCANEGEAACSKPGFCTTGTLHPSRTLSEVS